VQSHEGHFDDRFDALRRPYGADGPLLVPFPTLKRGANHHCASGAMKTPTSLVNNLDSCDCPAALHQCNQFVDVLTGNLYLFAFWRMVGISIRKSAYLIVALCFTMYLSYSLAF
jgi:hypothetical protein